MRTRKVLGALLALPLAVSLSVTPEIAEAPGGGLVENLSARIVGIRLHR